MRPGRAGRALPMVPATQCRPSSRGKLCHTLRGTGGPDPGFALLTPRRGSCSSVCKALRRRGNQDGKGVRARA